MFHAYLDTGEVCIQSKLDIRKLTILASRAGANLCVIVNGDGEIVSVLSQGDNHEEQWTVYGSPPFSDEVSIQTNATIQ